MLERFPGDGACCGPDGARSGRTAAGPPPTAHAPATTALGRRKPRSLGPKVEPNAADVIQPGRGGMSSDADVSCSHPKGVAGIRTMPEAMERYSLSDRRP